MKIFLGKLGRRKEIEAATNTYIDDIFDNRTAVPVSEVVEHLKKFGQTGFQKKIQNAEGG